MIYLLRADITTLALEASVNAANARLKAGGGVDGAIHRAAGPELQKALDQFRGCPTGSAVLTEGFRLPARYVIHAVGPVWHGGNAGEADLLESAYRSSFQLALDHGDIRTIAFSAISTGVYGYPADQAAGIALSVMREFEDRFEEIVACAFDERMLDVYETARRLDG